MAKPEWGLKRVCQSCSAKFYDMQRNPITCPKCGANFDPDALLKSRRPRPAAKATPKEAVKKPVESVEDDVLLDDSDDDDLKTDDDDDDAVLTNTDDLGGDSDLADVVIEGNEEET
ncbi:TIGR02300 family protein [Denitrobaculum tricleocarpae]|uniref:TIGR02300 family protein n=1 Tax=Denitrobaculum tricleocarpae TaxID=2591009 RepID=A0A545TGG1_9PROT|nr:TIGR02300 family protein [Denitrobaculum tricleocarpae]TQV76211.1 TIGR02300 family protein [Denitrobaculum tricleocarpae]